MNRNTGLIVAVGIALAVAVGLWVRGCGDRDERLIRKAFAELADAAEFEAREDMVQGGIRARAIGGFFVPDVSVDVTGLPMGVSSRAELVTLVFHMRTQLDQLKLELRDIEVVVGPDRRAARLSVSARAHVKGHGQQDAVWKDVEIDWAKAEDDRWRISAMRTIESIERR